MATALASKSKSTTSKPLDLTCLICRQTLKSKKKEPEPPEEVVNSEEEEQEKQEVEGQEQEKEQEDSSSEDEEENNDADDEEAGTSQQKKKKKKKKPFRYNGLKNQLKEDCDPKHAVATMCGHMFHVGCLRNHCRTGLHRTGISDCPKCSKPVDLEKLWPILVPSKCEQVTKTEKLDEMEEQNNALREELARIKLEVDEYTAELAALVGNTDEVLADIKKKQKVVDELKDESSEEEAEEEDEEDGEESLEELMNQLKERQEEVHRLARENAEILGVAMHGYGDAELDPDYRLSEEDLVEVAVAQAELDEKHRELQEVLSGESLPPPETPKRFNY